MTPASFHGEERPATRWHVVATGLSVHRRGLRHEALEGVGKTEIEALDELVRRLEERAQRSS